MGKQQVYLGGTDNTTWQQNIAIRHNLSRDSIALLELLFPPRIAALAP